MNKKVTYSDIVNALSRKTGFSKQKTEAFVKALLNEVKNELNDSGKASITNFGSFKVKEVAQREGKNPQTGESIIIPAHKRVSFSPYKSLREDVNAKYGHLESELIDDEESVAEVNIIEQSEETDSADNPNEIKAEDEKAGVIPSSPDESEEKELVTETTGSESEEQVEPESGNESAVESQVSEDLEEVEDIEASEKNEEEEEPSSHLIVSETEEKKENNYNNLLASLAVLMLTIIAVTTVLFLLDNGSGKTQQSSAQNAMMAEGQQVAFSSALRSAEEIRKEADEVEKRINALIKEEERLRTWESEIENVDRSPVDEISAPDNSTPSSVNANVSQNKDQADTQNYEVQEGEWYWVISGKLYGKPRFWPLLFMENHTVSEDPDSLLKLTNINVPVMEGTAANPTKQDYMNLAAATKMVAEAYENAGKTVKAKEYAKIARKWEQMGA